MTIKQQGGVFGRNPTFNDVTVESELDLTGATIVGSPTFNAAQTIPSSLTITGGTVDRQIKLDAENKTINTATEWSSSGTTEFIQTMKARASGSWRYVGLGQVGADLRFYNSNTNADVTTGHAFSINTGKSIIMSGGGNVVFNAGNGIDFSATAGTGTSELLDDYEEGTFTPEIADASSGGNTGSAALAEGYYTKVGRLVTIAIALINIDTTGMTAGNNLHVRNLPFSQGAGVDHGSARVNAVTFSGSLSTYCTGTYALVADSVSGASFGYVTVGDCTSGSADIYMSFTYRV